MSDTTPETPAHTHAGPAKLEKASIWDVYYPSKATVDKDAVILASFPMIIYFWPAMLAFLCCGVMQSLGWMEPNTAGWIGTSFLAFNLMVIVTDLDQKKFVIVSLLLIVAGMGIWMMADKDVAIISSIGQWFKSLDMGYNTHTLFAIFTVFWFFFCLGMIQPRVNYWRIEPNEFVHYIQPFGRDQSIPRLGSTVSREVPDILELLLTFGGGTLVVRREGQAVARIEHVPFLGRRMVAIERMLGVTRVKEVG